MSTREQLLSGNRLELTRFLTRVENGDPESRVLLDEMYLHAGKAQRIGITGAPGTGKSSLVNKIAVEIRRSLNKTVAIIAVDPSSPFTGGAILGDRLRMRDLVGDPGVFIRSMASRGALGGLAITTTHLARVFDAAGYDFIIIETVGAGQSEVEIARLAHTTIVVEAPGFGDDIQAIKAGIMEIADILVINKADLPGVENTERALRANLELGYNGVFSRKTGHSDSNHKGEETTIKWTPPVLRTIAPDHQGIAEVVAAVVSHYEFLNTSGQLQQLERERLKQEITRLLQARLIKEWQEKAGELKIDVALQKVAERQWSPNKAVDWLVEQSS
jgi:LAO/AO transport system kinase